MATMLAGPVQRENLGIFIAALVPVCVMGLLVVTHLGKNPRSDLENGASALVAKVTPLENNMNTWPTLNWQQKETAVYMAVDFLRKRKNCAILKSPQHYVTLIDQTLQRNPGEKKKSLLTLLVSLAIMEYDFFNGLDADEQAMQLLGPEGFAENKKRKQAEEGRIAPVREE